MRRGFLVLALLVLSLSPFAGLSASTPDGRAGVVIDLQGTVVVRPLGQERFSPLTTGDVLWPGQIVKVLSRGANAAEISLRDGGSVVLGPGAVAEIESGSAVHLLRGEAEVTGVTLTAPGGFTAIVKGTSRLRAKDEQTVLLDSAPKWLEGYRANTATEWLGSLIAEVDGRSVPLDIGFHQVNVVIRDQIAETTITESFVNNTGSVLEGEFVFPLPAGASVSGFGMWIDGELVMADIVERGRAREIYEDIKRRRKDPGLLEWSGGNLFKARVFPIPRHGEKRIRIRYTQVLPFDGRTGSVRYRYPLRSEMLAHHPLRQLSIRVSAESTVPFTGASSPTHEVSVESSAHHALVTFDAEEYAPQRDFEAVFNLQPVPPLTVIPHRRGDDGYFMLLLTAGPHRGPAAAVREPPVDLVLIADTSGSMSRVDREWQEEFIETLLALLGPDDRFRLAALDTDLVWVAKEHQPPDAADEVLARLAARTSLGWTDLTGGLAKAMEVPAGPLTQFVYLGDGIGTKEPPDPGKLAAGIRRLKLPNGAGIHAVSTGSSYEAGVLEAIADLGKGTARTAGDDPATAAAALMNEITSPTIEDMTLTIKGLRTARVYPERLPRWPAGTQQVILGRFLPTGEGARGEVIVRGRQGDLPVEFKAPFLLEENEQGNSFLPRLWARSHLDALTGDGINAANRDEIIEFSRRFGIITPLTSFLVLENDEDRERYGVKRMVGMRDGERFFADSRDRTRNEAQRTQMQLAESWRAGLKAQMLAGIRKMARPTPGPYGRYPGGRRGGSGGGMFGFASSRSEVAHEMLANSSGDGVSDGPVGMEDFEQSGGNGPKTPPGTPPGEPMTDFMPPPETPSSLRGPYSGPMGEVFNYRSSGYFGAAEEGEALFADEGRADWVVANEFHRRRYGSANLLNRFPYLPPPMEEKKDEFVPAWPKEAIALLEGLERKIVPDSVDTGLMVVYRHEAGRGDAASIQRTRNLIAPGCWFAATTNRGTPPTAQWLADGQRGSLHTATRLGRKRTAAESDYQTPHHFIGLSVNAEIRGYTRWAATLSEGREGLTILTLTPPNQSPTRLEFLIDPDRKVIVERRWFEHGKLTARSRFSGFTEALGHLWPTLVLHEDKEGTVTGRTTIRITAHEAGKVAEEIAGVLAGYDDVIFLPGVNPTLAEAKQAAFDGSAGIPERLVLLDHHLGLSRPGRVQAQWVAIKDSLVGKPGANWLLADISRWGRGGEDLEELLTALAAGIGKTGRTYFDRQVLAEEISRAAESSLSPPEQIRLLDLLSPVFSEEGEDAGVHHRTWGLRRARLLFRAGREAEARGCLRELLRQFPESRTVYLAALQQLAEMRDQDEFLSVADRAMAAAGKWEDGIANNLLHQIDRQLWQWNLPEQHLGAMERMVGLLPKNHGSYEGLLVALNALDRREELVAFLGSVIGRGVPAVDDLAARARLQATIRYLAGQSYRIQRNSFEPEFEAPVASLARKLLACEDDRAQYGEELLRSGQFAETTAGRKLEQEALRVITSPETVMKLSFPRLAAHHSIFEWRQGDLDRREWQRIVAALLPRWRVEEERNARDQLKHWLLRIYEQIGEPDAAISLIEEELAREDEERAWVADDLAERILGRPWTLTREDRLFDLLPLLIPAYMTEQERPRQAEVVTARLVRGLLRMRLLAAFGTAEERAKLTRADLRTHDDEARKRVRGELATRLNGETKTIGAEFRVWLWVERLGLLAEAGLKLKNVGAEANEILRSISPETENAPSRRLIVRSLAILDRLAIRADAPAELVERVVARREALAQDTQRRLALFQLLVALDRFERVESLLREWIEPERVESRWRVALGFILAQQGDLRGAITQFEDVDALEELGPGGLKSLADWNFVLGRDEERTALLSRRFDRMPVYAFHEIFQQELARVRPDGKSGGPATIRPEILLAARSLMRRAPRPGEYLHLVLELYDTTKDVRILDALPLGMIGHSPEAIYDLLSDFSTDCVANIHEEATLDGLREQAMLAFPLAKTDTDRRALRLLLALVEGRAANVIDEPKPHARASLAALQATFEGEFAPTERRLYAHLLWFLDSGDDENIDRERLRQMSALLAAETDPVDRFAIAADLSEAEWKCGKPDRAINVAQSALSEFREYCGGPLPTEARPVVSRLRDWLSQLGRFLHAEELLVAELQRQREPRFMGWLERELNKLAGAAFAAKGEMSFGGGEKLYGMLGGFLVRTLKKCPPTEIDDQLNLYLAFVATAKEQGIEDAAADFVDFTRSVFPKVLVRIRDSRQRHRRTIEVAGALRDFAGPLAEVTFLLERLEAEPEWYRAANRNGWHTLAERLAAQIRKVKLPPELEERLFLVVMRELRRDLISTSHSYRYFYGGSKRSFWKEKAAAFAERAREILAEHHNDPAIVNGVCMYLYHDLKLKQEGTDTLLAAAHRWGFITDDSRLTLTGWLLKAKRYEEALAQAHKLHASDKNNMNHRRMMILCLDATGRKVAADAYAMETILWFKREKIWDAHAMRDLGRVTLKLGYFVRSEQAWRELTELYLAQPRRQGRRFEGELSEAWANLAKSLAGLGRTDEAIEAAAKAVVVWGRRKGRRDSALKSLREVFASVKDLDAWVVKHEESVAKTGLDAPLLRHASGSGYLSRKQVDKAVEQLRIARQLSPTDEAIHRTFGQAAKKSRKKDLIEEGWLAYIAAFPRQLRLYDQLGRFYGKIGRKEEAERAFTTLAEADPYEPEGRAMLEKMRKR